MAEFVVYPNQALFTAAHPRTIDDAMLAAGAAVLDAAQSVQAYGLAAAHLGLNEPVVVVSVADDSNRRDYRICFNPTVELVSKETLVGPEGSVSLPGIEVPVERPVWADIAYFDTDGVRITVRLEGLPARVAVHEIDQMNGMFFLTQVSRIKRETALRKFEKSRRQQG